MAATNRRQLLTGAAAYAAGAAIVAGGAALASEAHGATITPSIASLIAKARAADAKADHYEGAVFQHRSRTAGASIAIAESNALNDAYADALTDVANCPVTSVADLDAKLTFMRKHEMGDERDWLPIISADVRRIVEARA